MDNDGFVKPTFVAPKPVKPDENGIRNKETKKKKETKEEAGPEDGKSAGIVPDGAKPDKIVPERAKSAEDMETEDKQTRHGKIEDSNKKVNCESLSIELL